MSCPECAALKLRIKELESTIKVKRAHKFDPEVHGPKVLEYIKQGLPISKFYRLLGFKFPSAIWDWTRQNPQLHAKLCNNGYANQRRARCQAKSSGAIKTSFGTPRSMSRSTGGAAGTI